MEFAYCLLLLFFFLFEVDKTSVATAAVVGAAEVVAEPVAEAAAAPVAEVTEAPAVEEAPKAKKAAAPKAKKADKEEGAAE